MEKEVLAVRSNREWTLAEMEKAAQYMVKSGLFGVRDTTQAIALMLLAQAEGVHPARAVQEYHIIQGRPALRADAMLARFLAAGGRVEWHALTNERAEATFSHPQGGSVRIAWTLEDAQRAGLLQREGWQKYPRAMLRARVISEGVRTVFPGVATGVYTPEEVADMAPEPVSAQVVETRVVEPQAEGGATPQLGDITPKQIKYIQALLSDLDHNMDREGRRAFVAWVLGRELGSVKDLSREEASQLIDILQTRGVELLEKWRGAQGVVSLQEVEEAEEVL